MAETLRIQSRLNPVTGRATGQAPTQATEDPVTAATKLLRLKALLANEKRARIQDLREKDAEERAKEKHRIAQRKAAITEIKFGWAQDEQIEKEQDRIYSSIDHQRKLEQAFRDERRAKDAEERAKDAAGFAAQRATEAETRFNAWQENQEEEDQIRRLQLKAAQENQKDAANERLRDAATAEINFLNALKKAPTQDEIQEIANTLAGSKVRIGVTTLDGGSMIETVGNYYSNLPAGDKNALATKLARWVNTEQRLYMYNPSEEKGPFPDRYDLLFGPTGVFGSEIVDEVSTPRTIQGFNYEKNKIWPGGESTLNLPEFARNVEDPSGNERAAERAEQIRSNFKILDVR